MSDARMTDLLEEIAADLEAQAGAPGASCLTDAVSDGMLHQRAEHHVHEREARYAWAPGVSCLADAVLGALAEGTLPDGDRQHARSHLDTCLACVRRYATMRSLLEASRGAESDHQQPVGAMAAFRLPRWWPRFTSFGDLRAVRLPLAWTFVASAASILVTVAATTFVLSRGTPGPPPTPLTPLQQPAGQTRTVTGLVEEVRDASAEGGAAHVVQLRDAAGASYVLLAWGPARARAGDTIRVDGVFVKVTEGDGPVIYRGLARSYQITRTQK